MSTTIPLEVGDICWARTSEGLQRVTYTGNERDAEMDLTSPEQYAKVARRVANRLGLPLEGRVEVAPLAGRFVVVVGSEAEVIVGRDEETAFAGVLNGPAVSRGADAAVEVLTAEIVAVDEASVLEVKPNRQELVMPDWLYMVPSEFAWGCRRCNAFSISLDEVERLGTQEALNMALTEHEAKCSGHTPEAEAERSKLLLKRDEAEARLREAVEAVRPGVLSSEALPSEPVAAVSEVVAQPVVAPVSEPRRRRKVQ